MKVEAHLSLEKIRHDQDTDAHLVLTLTAPPIEAQTQRPRLCIIPLIDVSPSMYEHMGEKIAYAKRSVEKLIDHLAPTDYCGLVQFSGTAEVLQRPIKVTSENKAILKRKVTDLSCGNATNIADALLKGLELGNKLDLPGDVIVRVVLFTDGQANRGPETTMAGLVKLLEANLGSCTASAFGYGSDADQNLLGELAKKGSGNYAFVQNPDDALTAFGKELGGLLSTYATNLLINVSACADHEISEVISDVDSEEEKVGQGVRIKIPDILAEEVRQIVLAVKLKAQVADVHKATPRPLTVFNVKAGWDILDANCKKQREGAEAKAKVQFVKPGEEQKAPNDDLNKIVSLAEVIHAQLEAEEKAKRGDFVGAQKRMKLAANLASSRGHHHGAHLARQLSARLGDAQSYHDNGGYLRSISGGGTRAMGLASYNSDAQADLMQAGIGNFSNASQTSTSNAFAGGGFVVAPDAVPAVDLSSFVPGTVGSVFPGLGTVVTTGSVIGASPLGGAAHWQGGLTADPGASFVMHNNPLPVPPLPPNDDEAPKAMKSGKKGLSRKSKSW